MEIDKEPYIPSEEVPLFREILQRALEVILLSYEVTFKEKSSLEELARECLKYSRGSSFRELTLGLLPEFEELDIKLIEGRSALAVLEDWIRDLTFDPQAPQSPLVFLDTIRSYRASLFWTYESLISRKGPKRELKFNPKAKSFVPGQ